MIELKSAKKYLGIVTGFLMVSYSLAQMFIYAKNGFTPGSVAMAFTGWTGYLMVHYAETGILVDPRADEKQMPRSDNNWLVFALASVLFVVGMSVGALGVKTSNVFQSFIGASIVIAGYFIAHYELTDCLV